MQIYSFIKQGFDLKPVEIELSFLSGLSGIKFIGQPDSTIKESEIKIKSALKYQEFELPRGKQILVNLKPAHIKKRSQGLDLAVAAAILWATGQVDSPGFEKVYVYGELGVQGEVFAPEDLEFLAQELDGPLVTGKGGPSHIEQRRLEVLKDLAEPDLVQQNLMALKLKRPKLQNISFCEKSAEALLLLAYGEHSGLVAGPSGSGKTTFAQALFSLLKDPYAEVYRRSRKINHLVGYNLQWRPFVDPHHTITPLAMVGGGYPVFPGEISRAHGGMLYLDELLEFNSKVKEALREPIETGQMTIRRKGDHIKVPAKFMLVASSNLCPCGDLVPNKIQSCRFSLTRCRSYLERLSGPLLDRFAVLVMSDRWQGEKTISLESLYQRLEKVRAFAKAQGRGELVLADTDPNKIQIDPFILENLMPEVSGSLRRSKALFRVARSLADLDLCEEISPQHIEKASQYTIYPFEQLRHIFA